MQPSSSLHMRSSQPIPGRHCFFFSLEYFHIFTFSHFHFDSIFSRLEHSAQFPGFCRLFHEFPVASQYVPANSSWNTFGRLVESSCAGSEAFLNFAFAGKIFTVQLNSYGKRRKENHKLFCNSDMMFLLADTLDNVLPFAGELFQ